MIGVLRIRARPLAGPPDPCTRSPVVVIDPAQAEGPDLDVRLRPEARSPIHRRETS
ncbi:hypothetical protein CyaNS01_02547 [Cyanobium sp. NS01]|nr:hypothetical protein CyaNS01_02547 [Cyanobium sp. NS01]